MTRYATTTLALTCALGIASAVLFGATLHAPEPAPGRAPAAAPAPTPTPTPTVQVSPSPSPKSTNMAPATAPAQAASSAPAKSTNISPPAKSTNITAPEVNEDPAPPAEDVVPVDGMVIHPDGTWHDDVTGFDGCLEGFGCDTSGKYTVYPDYPADQGDRLCWGNLLGSVTCLNEGVTP